MRAILCFQHQGVGRAYLEQCLRPKPGLFHQFAVYEIAGAFVGHREKRPDIIAVIAEDIGVEVEYAHDQGY